MTTPTPEDHFVGMNLAEAHRVAYASATRWPPTFINAAGNELTAIEDEAQWYVQIPRANGPWTIELEINRGYKFNRTPAETVTTPKKPWTQNKALAFGSLVVFLIIVGVIWTVTGHKNGGGSDASSAFTLRGTMTLETGHMVGFDGCHGTNGYSDIATGTAITVYDDAGKVVAVGSLPSGTRELSTYTCTWSFAVPNVPDGSPFYQVEVSHRGKITATADEAKAGMLSMSLGN